MLRKPVLLLQTLGLCPTSSAPYPWGQISCVLTTNFCPPWACMFGDFSSLKRDLRPAKTYGSLNTVFALSPSASSSFAPFLIHPGHRCNPWLHLPLLISSTPFSHSPCTLFSWQNSVPQKITSWEFPLGATRENHEVSYSGVCAHSWSLTSPGPTRTPSASVSLCQCLSFSTVATSVFSIMLNSSDPSLFPCFQRIVL